MSSSTHHRSNASVHTVWILISTTLAILAFAVACVAIYQVRAARSEMVLVDGAGRQRVRIAATNDGGAIELFDERGRVRIALRQAAGELSISMHRREAPQDGSPDFAMHYTVQENPPRNAFQMRDPASHSIITLGTQASPFLSLQSGKGGVSFSASEFGASFRLDFMNTRLHLELAEQGGYVHYNNAIFDLDDVSPPHK